MADRQMELYLVAVILAPTEKQKFDDGAVPQIVVQPTAVLAKDEAGAGAKALGMVPQEHAGKDDRLDVRVLSFRSVAALAR